MGKVQGLQRIHYLVASLSLIAGTTFFIKRFIPSPVTSVRICLAATPSNALPVIAEDKNFFSEEGLNATLVVEQTSAACVRSLLSNNVDFAATTLSPVVQSLVEGKEMVLVTELQNSTECLGIAYLKNGSINTVADLRHKKIGVVKGSGGETFLRLFLASNEIQLSDVQIVKKQTLKEVRALFLGGELDAAVIFEPELSELSASQIGDSLGVFQSSLFSDISVLVSSRTLAQISPSTVDAVMRSLQSAQKFYEKQTEFARGIVSSRLRLDTTQVTPVVWDKFQVGLGLSAVLVNMINHTEETFIMPDKPLVETGGINILHFVYPQALRKLGEELVSYE